MFDLREVHEIIEIVAAFEETPAPAALAKLRLLPRGSERADDDTSTHPRDIQYELALHALLKTAGIKATLGDPDLSATYAGRTIPIQAKRPGSIKRLDDRIRSAVSQLDACGEQGIIAISLDQVIRPRTRFFSVASHPHAGELLQQAVIEFINNHKDQIERRVARDSVAGIVFTTVAPGRSPTSGMLITGQSYYFRLLVPESSAMGTFLLHFSNALEASL